MRTALGVGAALAVVACGSDALSPVTVGEPYQLRLVNGQPLPWSTPLSDSLFIPTTIVEGSVTFLSESMAQRHEEFGRWVILRPGDSTWLAGVWTQIATYERGSGTIVLTYPLFAPGAIGPSQAAETLYVTRGRLTLRQTGLFPQLDSIIRVYCVSPDC